MDTNKFKILSIDGGGIRGIIPAKVLCDLEEELVRKQGEDARLCDYFDLVCGTSTGAIIAIGIALGMKARDILDLYMNKAKIIFPPKSVFKSFITNNSFYSRDSLKKLIRETYADFSVDKDTRIYHCKTRVCIPTYDLEKGEMHVYKTDHLPGLFRDAHIPAADVALASASAPIYFNPYSFGYENMGSKNQNIVLNNIDGGVLANNPALIGLTEAIYCIEISLKKVALLSIGTGSFNLKDDDLKQKKGPRYWINPKSKKGFRLYELMSSAQSLYIDNTIKMFHKGCGCNNENRFDYLRIQQTLDKNIPLDSVDKDSLNILRSIGQDLYKKHAVSMIPFLEEKIIPYKHNINI